MLTRDEKLSRKRRLWFALFFAVIPNAIAFLIARACNSLLAAAYLFSLPGVVALVAGSSKVAFISLELTVLLDGGMAYLLTALKCRWLGFVLLGAYVVISRFIALYVLGMYVAIHT